MRNFRELEIWKMGIDFTVSIYSLTEKFPDSEKFGLCSQLKRAAISIPSNIAEGCRGTNKELINFLNIALGSTFEIETQLIISQRLLYINESEFNVLLSTLETLQRKINAFRNSVLKKS